MEIGSRGRALEIFRGTLPPQRSEEAQGRKISSAQRDPDFHAKDFSIRAIASSRRASGTVSEIRMNPSPY
jgi:hypothetical protein